MMSLRKKPRIKEGVSTLEKCLFIISLLEGTAERWKQVVSRQVALWEM